jgi:hypothetical protein
MEVEEFIEIEKATSRLYLNERKRLVLLLDFQFQVVVTERNRFRRTFLMSFFAESQSMPWLQ